MSKSTKETVATLIMVASISFLLASVTALPIVAMNLFSGMSLHESFIIWYDILSEVFITTVIVVLGIIAMVIGINYWVENYGK